MQIKKIVVYCTKLSTMKDHITENYNYNPLVSAKHLQVICAGNVVNPAGELVHRVDVEHVETGMVYTYNLDAKIYAQHYTTPLHDPENVPVSGYFKYCNEIDREGLDNLIGTNYPQKRLLIYCHLKQDRATAVKIAKGLKDFKI